MHALVLHLAFIWANGLTPPSSFEFETVVSTIKNSALFQEKLEAIELPEGFDVVIEPWPYGGPDLADGPTRLFQGLCFGRDTRSGNPDANFYAYPLPLIPVVDANKRELVRVDEPATGGKGDLPVGKTSKTARVLDHCRPAEYVPELLPGGTRKDVKPLTVIQPEGPSFTISDGNLVQWQKWRMRLSFNPREGAVLHDICYDGRDVIYRLSMSEMVRVIQYAYPALFSNSHRRQSHMVTLVPHTTESRHSTSVTADWAMP